MEKGNYRHQTPKDWEHRSNECLRLSSEFIMRVTVWRHRPPPSCVSVLMSLILILLIDQLCLTSSRLLSPLSSAPPPFLWPSLHPLSPASSPPPPPAVTRAIIERWVRQTKTHRVALKRLISGMKFSPGFGGQSGEGKVGAAVNSTSSLLIGWICWSRSPAPPGWASLVRGCGPACHFGSDLQLEQLLQLTKDPAAGREEPFVWKLIRGLFYFTITVLWVWGGGGR